MSEKNKKVLEYLGNSQAPQEIINAANYVQGALETYERTPEFRRRDAKFIDQITTDLTSDVYSKAFQILHYLYTSTDFHDNYPAKIAEKLKLVPMTTLRHIKKLSEKGLVEATRIGHMKFYKLTQDGISEIEKISRS